MAAIETITLLAPAKVNLHLSVGRTRPDGFHEVSTIVHALALSDVVHLEPADALSVECRPSVTEKSEDNTAVRAALSLASRLGKDPAVTVTIEKSIPVAAGLAGGSSDAAAVIVGLCRWWDTDPTGEDAMAAAAQVGADVPFFLIGGSALLEGRGDELVRSLPSLRSEIVLVNPGVPVSTADAYAAFDRLAPEPRGPEAMARALEAGDVEAVADLLFNNMTEASRTLAPEIAETLGWLRGRPEVIGSAQAGSGATCFGICRNAETASHVAADARAHGWWAEATALSPWGIRSAQASEGIPR